MVGVFIIHVCPGKWVGVPWVKSSSSIHDPINSIRNLMMDVWTAIIVATIANEVSTYAAIDTTCAW